MCLPTDQVYYLTLLLASAYWALGCIMSNGWTRQDPFEVHRLQASASLKKMKRENRLNILSQSNRVSKRKPLGEISVNTEQKGNSSKKNSYTQMHNVWSESTPNVLLQTGTVLNTKSTFSRNEHIKQKFMGIHKSHPLTDLTLHSASGISRQKSKIPLSAFQVRQRVQYDPSIDNLLAKLHKTPNESFHMVKQAYVYADEILRGFQNRRLKYIRDSTTGNVKTLKATKDKNELETYKILSVARIGKLAFTVEVRNTSTEENRIIMLVNPCNVNLKSNDQLVLPSSPSQSQMINGNLISIYYKWELKKRREIESII